MNALDPLREGLEAFNQRHFYDSHELLEIAWKQAPKAERPLYQGLIQLAAAYLKIEHQDYEPAIRLLHRALEKLEPFGSSWQGIALGALVREAKLTLERIELLRPERISEFPAAWYPRIERLTSEDGAPKQD